MKMRSNLFVKLKKSFLLI